MVRFIPKAITIYTNKKAWFNYKNNYKYYKLATFGLDTIKKIYFELLIMILYTSLGLKSRNI